MKKSELKEIINQQAKIIAEKDKLIRFYEQKNIEIVNYINLELAKITHR